MALDRWLLETASRPVLRFYSWQPYTLSLGRHQEFGGAAARRARERGIPVVRRDTGGRAVFHARELTYSVIIPREHPLAQLGLQPLYRLLNSALLSGLAELGVPVARETRRVDLRQHYQQPTAAVCFSTPVETEVTVGGRKLVGSAQRRFQQGVLQHGSLLLGREHREITAIFHPPEKVAAALGELDEHAVCLAEVLAEVPSQEELAEILARAFARTLNLEFQELHLDSEQWRQVKRAAPEFRVQSSPESDLP